MRVHRAGWKSERYTHNKGGVCFVVNVRWAPLSSRSFFTAHTTKGPAVEPGDRELSSVCKTTSEPSKKDLVQTKGFLLAETREGCPQPCGLGAGSHHLCLPSSSLTLSLLLVKTWVKKSEGIAFHSWLSFFLAVRLWGNHFTPLILTSVKQ